MSNFIFLPAILASVYGAGKYGQSPYGGISKGHTVVFVIAGVGLLFLLLVFFIRRRRRAQQQSQEWHNWPPQNPQPTQNPQPPQDIQPPQNP